VINEILLNTVWQAVELTIFSRSLDCVEADRIFMCSTVFAHPEKQVQYTTETAFDVLILTKLFHHFTEHNL
jgi:uncharacterized membrane protein (DUF373 family)